MKLAQWLYRGGRPNHLAMLLNRFSALLHALGIAPNYLVTLEVQGRRSGRKIALPLVMVSIAGERYLVSMLGADVNWVRNVRAAGGRVTLRHGRREEVHLEEVPRRPARARAASLPAMRAGCEAAHTTRQGLAAERVRAHRPAATGVPRALDLG